jgi:hypothetical protein
VLALGSIEKEKTVRYFQLKDIVMSVMTIIARIVMDQLGSSFPETSIHTLVAYQLSYSLRSILLFAIMGVSSSKIYLDTSILAGRREYHIMEMELLINRSRSPGRRVDTLRVAD